MIDANYTSVTDLAARQRLRRAQLTAALVLVVLVIFGTMGAVPYVVPRASGPVIFAVGLGFFVCLAVPALIWNYPRAGLYIILAGAMVFEAVPGVTVFTMRVPFFWNLNVFGREYGIPILGPVKSSIAEILMVLTVLAWVIRTISRRQARFRPGTLAGWMAVYLVLVLAGLAHGLANGGDLLKALWEVRGQVYLVLAYFLATNLVENRRQVSVLLWIMVVGVAFKGVLGALQYAALGGKVTEDGILSHEESLFFDLLFFILLLAILTRADRKLTWAAVAATPCALLSALANQRRAGVASFIVAFVPLIPILWVLIEERRTQIMRFGIAFAVLSAVYLPVAWNSNSAWALPARAIRSNSEPNERDNASNYYRLLEDANLKYTRDLEPWTGVGFGIPFAQIHALPTVSTEMLQYYAHNSILWVWMRLGNLGFFTLMMLFGTAIITGLQFVKRTQDRLLMAAGVLAILCVLVVFTFGKYDLQLINYRTMWTLGTFLGVLSVLPVLDAAGRRGGDQAHADHAAVAVTGPAGSDPAAGGFLP